MVAWTGHQGSEPFPRLRMASVESGAAWVPELLHRLSDAAIPNPRYFKEHPADAFREHVCVTPFWEDDVESLVADMPAEHLLLGSDWPHAEGVAEPAEFVRESLAWATAGVLRKIARDNAVNLLGVGVP